jgi:hypothetical protein
MWIKFLFSAVALVAVLMVWVAMRPSEFRVSRSGFVAAPPEVVFPHVNDLHNWEAWSPWAKLDPGAKTSYDGPVAGLGASFSWAGNRNIGEGRMTISESKPNESVRFRIEFLKPFKGTNLAEFTFTPDGERTRVTWTMTGRYGFIPKLMGLIINCDKRVGDQFEKGLADLNLTAGATLVSK